VSDLDWRTLYQTELLAWITGQGRQGLDDTLASLHQQAQLPLETRQLIRICWQSLGKANPPVASPRWARILGRIDRLLMLHATTNDARSDQVRATQLWLRQALSTAPLDDLNTEPPEPRPSMPLIHPSLQDGQRHHPKLPPKWIAELCNAQWVGLPKGIVSSFKAQHTSLNPLPIDETQPNLGLQLFSPIVHDTMKLPLVSIGWDAQRHQRFGGIICVIRTPLGVPAHFSHFGLLARMVIPSDEAASNRNDLIHLDWVTLARAIEAFGRRQTN
jgi:hypothetical protein